MRRRILHILTRPDAALAEKIIAAQQADPALDLEVIDWTQGEPDLEQLVRLIFEADSIEVW